MKDNMGLLIFLGVLALMMACWIAGALLMIASFVCLSWPYLTFGHTLNLVYFLPGIALFGLGTGLLYLANHGPPDGRYP